MPPERARVVSATGARRGQGGRFARVYAAIVAADLDDRRQAFLTTRLMLWFSSVSTLGYFVFYAIALPGITLPLLVNGVSLVFYGVAFGCLVRRHQLAATVMALSMATIQILVCAGFFGWSTGFHLYLVAAGQLVFMIFTNEQVWWRWGYIALAAASFIYCQVILVPERALFEVGPGERITMFSANALGTGVLIYGFAVITHARAMFAQTMAREAAARAEYLASIDALTGLANRRPIMLELDRLSQSGVAPYCLAIGDLDGFKAFNDTHGHMCGDAVLAAVARTLQARVRPTDIVGRWGGEEFIFVLPNATLTESDAMLERLRAEVEGFAVECSDHVHRVTISIGVADGARGMSPFGVLKRADDAMYDAKAAGRNVVRVRRPEEAPGRAPRGAGATGSARVQGSPE